MNTCIIEITKDGGTRSCTGTILSRREGIILTHGSLLSPYLDKPIIERLHKTGFYSKPFENIFPTIYFEKCSSVLSSVQSNVAVQTLSSSQQGIWKETAKIMCIFKCIAFDNTLTKLMPKSDGWKFSDMENEKNYDEFKAAVILPCFILLHCGTCSNLEKINVDNNDEEYRDLTVINSKVKRGDPVYACSAPFGSLSPEVFINSVSQGIVSNISPDGSLILTDARCIPGAEGGALYRNSSGKSHIVGVIVCPLCWKNNEWVGLSVVCSLDAVLKSLRRYFPGLHINERQLSDRDDLGNIRDTDLGSSTKLQGIQNAVVLVKVGGTWGSGYILDWATGLVITCSHVVKGASETKILSVRLDHPKQQWYKADIIYNTPDGKVFDIALLKLPKIARSDQNQVLDSLDDQAMAAQQGSPAYVIGHGLLGEPASMPPYITAGVISKVVKYRGQQVMVQSSCAVHGGASGGPLVSESGKVLGIVTCNARDTQSGASYPHINMSVPIVTILPIIKEYLKTQDELVLQKIDLQNSTVQKLWTLEKLGFEKTVKSQL